LPAELLWRTVTHNVRTPAPVVTGAPTCGIGDSVKIRRFSQLPGRRRGAQGPVDLTFMWNPARPHEVVAALQGEGYPSRRWAFDRELLVVGTTRATGLGSVSVLPDLFSARPRPWVELVLAAADETVVVPLELVKVSEFLAATSPSAGSSPAAA
jgi:Streptomyces sporulation and cell division protein, SsgA